jgi:hypothetical protein
VVSGSNAADRAIDNRHMNTDVERSIGERPSNRRGTPVTGIRRIYPPEAMGL